MKKEKTCPSTGLFFRLNETDPEMSQTC